MNLRRDIPSPEIPQSPEFAPRPTTEKPPGLTPETPDYLASFRKLQEEVKAVETARES